MLSRGSELEVPIALVVEPRVQRDRPLEVAHAADRSASKRERRGSRALVEAVRLGLARRDHGLVRAARPAHGQRERRAPSALGDDVSSARGRRVLASTGGGSGSQTSCECECGRLAPAARPSLIERVHVAARARPRARRRHASATSSELVVRRARRASGRAAASGRRPPAARRRGTGSARRAPPVGRRSASTSVSRRRPLLAARAERAGLQLLGASAARSRRALRRAACARAGRDHSDAARPGLVSGARRSVGRRALDERLDQVDRRREDDRRRLRRAELEQRLQVAELQRDRVCSITSAASLAARRPGTRPRR